MSTVKKYSIATVAKAIAAFVGSLTALGSALALALTDGVITGNEWAILIPLIGNCFVTPAVVFFVPNADATVIEGEK